MDNESRCLLRDLGAFLLASILGGFIGGILGGEISKCCGCKCLHHFHHKMGGRMNTMNSHNFDRQKNSDFETTFLEEEYIVIPKSGLNKEFKK